MPLLSPVNAVCLDNCFTNRQSCCLW